MDIYTMVYPYMEEGEEKYLLMCSPAASTYGTAAESTKRRTGGCTRSTTSSSLHRSSWADGQGVGI